MAQAGVGRAQAILSFLPPCCVSSQLPAPNPSQHTHATMLSRQSILAVARRLPSRARIAVPLTRAYATEAPATEPAKWPKKATPKPATNGNGTPPTEPTYEAKTIAHLDGQAPALDAAGLPMIDWANSFHGISSQPVTDEQFKALMTPVDQKDIEIKPDGVIYLPEIKYRRRLNEAFGPMGWGMIPKGEPVVGSSIVTREYALIVAGR